MLLWMMGLGVAKSSLDGGELGEDGYMYVWLSSFSVRLNCHKYLLNEYT